MGKRSRERRDNLKALSLTKQSSFFDRIRLFVDENRRNFPDVPKFKFLNAVCSDNYTDEWVNIHSTIEIEQFTQKSNKLSGGRVADVYNKLAGNTELRPPFNSIFFQLKPEAWQTYKHSGAFCIYVENNKTISVVGIHENSNGLTMENCTTHLQLDEHYRVFNVACSEKASVLEEGVAQRVTSQVVFLLGLMNCKNIRLVNHGPDPFTSEDYKTRYGRSMVTYKTLAINPIGKQYNSSEPKDYQGLMPLHLRRGNFAHYTEDAPLFGKYTGTFWRPATAVGEAKNGTVVKDYKVIASDPQTT